MLAINATETVREGSIFGQITSMDHEQLVICHDEATGLKALIGIHNTVLGPALGGTRMWPYASEEEAIKDVLRLSRGMTFKNSLAGLNLGGGKAVILGDPRLKSEAFMRRFGRFVESLGGRYVTAEDVNMKTSDMEYIALETRRRSFPSNCLWGIHGNEGGGQKSFWFRFPSREKDRRSGSWSSRKIPHQLPCKRRC